MRDEDVLVFRATSLGEDTRGSFSFLFVGAEIGLEKGSEDVDALSIAPTGAIHLSTVGKYSVGGVSGTDEDVVGFTSGAAEADLFEIVLDGDRAGLPVKADIGALSTRGGN